MTTSTTHRSVTKTLSVLVIDDDTFMLAYIADLLRDLGATEVSTAKSGAEGFATFDRQARKPDVIVCDIMMPGTDGFQFMETLAEREYKGGVVMISGADARTLKSASLMAKFHRLNVLGCISKPVEAQALRRALAGLH